MHRALFTGGSLLNGTVGRTDLVDPRLARRLAEAQWTSARLQAELDPPRLCTPPTASAASALRARASSDAATPSIGELLATHPALTTERETFVTDLVAGFGPVPAHYAHMAPLNRRGAGSTRSRPARPVTADQVADAVLAGAWVVDLRDRSALRGAAPARHGERGVRQPVRDVRRLAGAVGRRHRPAHRRAHVLEPALRDLADIGIDGRRGPRAHRGRPQRRRATAAPTGPTTSRRRAIRSSSTYATGTSGSGGHLPGALHLPVQDVEVAGATLPSGELWVHCQSGYRAGIAASLLQRMGRDVVHIDDSWDRVRELAIQTTPVAAA